jgi:exodeoxyribonuclease VIII
MDDIHVMVDLETFGTDINSVIIAIGAVKFNIKTGEVIDTFYSPVDPESCQQIGMVIDANTVMWWLHPDRDDARRALLKDEYRDDIFNALTGFNNWYVLGHEAGDPLYPVWGNGCMFDNQLLELAYKRVGQECPWTYKENRDYRTIRQILGSSYLKPPEVLAHHALEDAKWQAQHLVNILTDNKIEIG